MATSGGLSTEGLCPPGGDFRPGPLLVVSTSDTLVGGQDCCNRSLEMASVTLFAELGHFVSFLVD